MAYFWGDPAVFLCFKKEKIRIGINGEVTHCFLIFNKKSLLHQWMSKADVFIKADNFHQYIVFSVSFMYKKAQKEERMDHLL
jgi:hypothetical protein